MELKSYAFLLLRDMFGLWYRCGRGLDLELRCSLDIVNFTINVVTFLLRFFDEKVLVV
jgi:hypothetical protein